MRRGPVSLISAAMVVVTALYMAIVLATPVAATSAGTACQVGEYGAKVSQWSQLSPRFTDNSLLVVGVCYGPRGREQRFAIRVGRESLDYFTEQVRIMNQILRPPNG